MFPSSNYQGYSDLNSGFKIQPHQPGLFIPLLFLYLVEDTPLLKLSNFFRDKQLIAHKFLPSLTSVFLCAPAGQKAWGTQISFLHFNSALPKPDLSSGEAVVCECWARFRMVLLNGSESNQRKGWLCLLRSTVLCACLFVCLAGEVFLCSRNPWKKKNTILAEELNSLHHSLNFIRLLRIVITPSVTSLLHERRKRLEAIGWNSGEIFTNSSFNTWGNSTW